MPRLDGDVRVLVRGEHSRRERRRDESPSRKTDGSVDVAVAFALRARSRSSLRARSRSSLDPLTRVAANTETCASLVPLARVDSAARTRHAPASARIRRRRVAEPRRKRRAIRRTARRRSRHTSNASGRRTRRNRRRRAEERVRSPTRVQTKKSRGLEVSTAESRATASRASREADSRTADSRVGSCPESSLRASHGAAKDRRGRSGCRASNDDVVADAERLERCAVDPRAERGDGDERGATAAFAGAARPARTRATRQARTRASPSASHRRRSIATTTRSKGPPFERRTRRVRVVCSRRIFVAAIVDDEGPSANGRGVLRALATRDTRASSSRRLFVDGGSRNLRWRPRRRRTRDGHTRSRVRACRRLLGR